MRNLMLIFIITIVALSTGIAIPGDVSAYTPHSPILIDGNTGFTAANGVTGGDGTPAAPYVIDGWEINASSTNGIEIRNTDAHFTIRDVYVHSGGPSNDGIHLDNVTNGRVENATVSSSFYGVYLEASANCTLTRNNITNSDIGIVSSSSPGTMIDANSVSSNTNYGIYLDSSENATVSGNSVSGGSRGIYLFTSTNAVIVGNNVSSNDWNGIYFSSSTNITATDNIFTADGLSLFGDSLPHYNSHTITLDNLVNGKPLQYHKDCSGLDVNETPIGQLIVANCTNVDITNLQVSNTDVGILMAFVDDARITGNSVWNGMGGIYLDYTSNATVTANNVSLNSANGLRFRFVTNASITGNSLSWNGFNGLRMDYSSNSTLSANDVSNNGFGIRLFGADGIVVYHNNLSANSVQAFDSGGSGNSWDDGYPSAGNYWSDYAGVDLKWGPNQNLTGSDGIGDTPYVIDADSQDRYPLMMPFVPRVRPPVASGARLSGNGLENVTVEWLLSPDDGGGYYSVVEYEIYRGTTYDSDGLSYELIASVANGTSTFTDTLVGEGEPNSYFYVVCAVDRDNFTACARDHAGKFTRPLSPGPNLVSTPLIQSDEDIEIVLQTVEYDKVWSYDSPSQEWKWFMKNKEYRRGLWNINHTMGIWVSVTRDSNLTIAGVVPTQTTIHLYEGWNLVSFPSFNASYTGHDLRMDTAAIRVEGHDPSPPYHLRVLGDAEVLRAGYGYWVMVGADTTWTVNIQ